MHNKNSLGKFFFSLVLVSFAWRAGAEDELKFFLARSYIDEAKQRLQQIGSEIPFNFPESVEFRELDGPCGAIYFNHRIFLGVGDETCNSPAQNKSIVIHEYVHAIQDATLGPNVSLSQSANEGLADIIAALLTDNPLFGDGLWKEAPSWSRNLESVYFQAGEETGAYSQSLLMSGAWWSLRKYFSNDEIIRILLESLVSIKDTMTIYSAQAFHQNALHLISGALTQKDNFCSIVNLFFRNKLITELRFKEFFECVPSKENASVAARELVVEVPLENAKITNNSFTVSFSLSNLQTLIGEEKLLDSSKYTIKDIAVAIEIDRNYYENVAVAITELGSQSTVYYRGSEESPFSRLPAPMGNAWTVKLKTPEEVLEAVKKISLIIRVGN